MSLKSPFLIGVQETMRMRGYSIRTEKTYLYWIKCSGLIISRPNNSQWGRNEFGDVAPI
ncbi:phage integrase N-terminal SAM-like domain-containing protein [Vibrio fluvialis]|uniref:phage integrase N-terminal SAM-like domain-containing protein n=1 Tax=Vibrio fluvialis TaxID=676 RepID=UPI003B97339E